MHILAAKIAALRCSVIEIMKETRKRRENVYGERTFPESKSQIVHCSANTAELDVFSQKNLLFEILKDFHHN